jgi:hypothetical protein
MSQRRYTVIIETANSRTPAKFTVPATATQVDVAMQARAHGLQPYHVRFESVRAAWVIKVIDWKRAA